MPNLLLNFDEDDFKGFEPIPAGIYNARVDTSELVIDKSQKGEAMLKKLAFVIEEDKEYAGRKVYSNYMLEGRGKPIFARFLKALGIVNGATQKQSFNTDDLHNLPCRIKVIQKPREDDPSLYRNEVREVIPPKEGTKQPKRASKLGF